MFYSFITGITGKGITYEAAAQHSPHYTWDPSSGKADIAHITLWKLLIYPCRKTKQNNVKHHFKLQTILSISRFPSVKHQWHKAGLYPSTASSRNQIKFSRGCTKGGPLSMDGCFSVYVLNTTEALFLFFKQRNLEGLAVERRKGRLWRSDRAEMADRLKIDPTCWRSTSQCCFLHSCSFWTLTLKGSPLCLFTVSYKAVNFNLMNLRKIQIFNFHS